MAGGLLSYLREQGDGAKSDGAGETDAGGGRAEQDDAGERAEGDDSAERGVIREAGQGVGGHHE